MSTLSLSLSLSLPLSLPLPLSPSLSLTDSPLPRSSVSLECLSLLLSVYRCLLSASLVGKEEVKGHRGTSTQPTSLPFPRSLLRAVLRREGGGEDLLTELREIVQVSLSPSPPPSSSHDSSAGHRRCVRRTAVFWKSC